MLRTTNKSKPPTPTELRTIFGENLRRLASRHASVAGLCRELGINRTQFNRYLASESFPRPDVLYRICSFFEVDARVLLEPVENIEEAGNDLLTHPQVNDFIGARATEISDELFPVGFYRFTRPSFVESTAYLQGLVYVYRADGYTFVRGYEAREAVALQGLRPDGATREFRGIMIAQNDGVSMLISRRNTLSTSFTYLTRVTSFENNFWVGYTTRTAPEALDSRRAARIVFEHLPTETGPVLRAARQTGLCEIEAVSAFHRKHLRIGEVFQ
ncbi:transcriptional regulator, XRE family [Poseidonocella pacifica]|uniref:Transcriptional regulator, XRE family n=1 Tax=Poseidonocella pacifica TaxID=871651 RepID=A0A1I0VBC6_9RHOB|nr:helix-turn-helix transcriptional regulator [Poseidonocella pacifica]SFA73552.1 transcriptional regulator, XRE family [Poseidonocella pacifica]